MIAYNKTLLDNTLLVDEASILKNSGFIDSIQYKTIIDKLPTLKTQKKGSIRAGLFFLGSSLYSSICGMLSFFIDSFDDFKYKILLYLCSLIGFVGMEFFAKQKFYRYGIDDAFLLGAQMVLFAAMLTSTDENYLPVCIEMVLVSIISYLRYVHLSSALLACVFAMASLTYLMFEFGTIGKSILPFVMIVFSAMGYFLSKKGLKNLKSTYYAKGIESVNNFSLILFYLSGNYMVVRELSILLLEKDIPVTQEIPFAIFFYVFTLSIPICYLFYSLIKKYKPMLWIGFLALAFSVFTILYYHHILPVEVALTLGGLVLFVFSYFLIKKIKNNETGITFLPDRFSDSNSLLNAETLIVASQFGLKPEIKPEESPMEFGAGDFSGGGSGGKF
jgi:hypothetical protein